VERKERLRMGWLIVQPLALELEKHL